MSFVHPVVVTGKSKIFLALCGDQSFKNLISFYSFCVCIEQAAWNCNVRALFCFHPPESPTNFPGSLLVRDVFTYGVRDSYAEFRDAFIHVRHSVIHASLHRTFFVIC